MTEPGIAALNNLPDSAFGWIESGGQLDSTGRTTPRSKRHFALNDAAAVHRSLAQASKSPFGKQALPKIMMAARKYNVKVSGDTRAQFGEASPDGIPERRFTRFPPEIRSTGDHAPKHIFGYAACFGKLSRRLVVLSSR